MLLYFDIIFISGQYVFYSSGMFHYVLKSGTDKYSCLPFHMDINVLTFPREKFFFPFYEGVRRLVLTCLLLPQQEIIFFLLCCLDEHNPVSEYQQTNSMSIIHSLKGRWYLEIIFALDKNLSDTK